MPGLNAPPPIGSCHPDVIRPFIPEAHWPLVSHVWEECAIPLASLKMENDLRKAIGITFTMAGYRYETGRRKKSVRAVCEAVGNRAAADLIIAASDAVRKALDLMCTPVEVIGFDVSPRAVRQLKAYIRTNAAHEHFEQSVIACEATTKEEEVAAVSAVLDLVAPHRRDSIVGILRSLQTTKGALEGIAIDLEGDAADVKLYFLPRRTGTVDERYSIEQTMDFVDRALEMFGLMQHRDRAAVMVQEMESLGLASSFLAVEQKPDGRHELKIDFNSYMSGGAFPDRRVPPEAAVAAIRSAYKAAALAPNEQDLEWIASRLGPEGVLLDDFTTDFGSDGCSGKVYLRPGSSSIAGAAAEARRFSA